MKKIYTITIDDTLPLLSDVENNIRVICYLLYDELEKLEADDRKILYRGKYIDKFGQTRDIILNELLDESNGHDYVYKFTSDEQDDDYRIYEPFIIDDKSFGFSVYDNSIDESELMNLLDEIQKLIKSNYKFKIVSFYYEDDEDRFNVIAKIGLGDNAKQVEQKHIKIRTNTILSMFGTMGR